MKSIVNGLAVEYRDEGTGKVVVLLHGWGVSAQNLEALQNVLTNKYRVISIDLPGFGASEPPHEAWAVSNYIELVASLLNKLSINSVHALIGHSFGARITIKGTGEDHFKPTKIILIGSAGVKRPKNLKSYVFMIAAKVGKLVYKLPGLSGQANRARQRLYAASGSSDYLQAGLMRDTFLKVIDEDLQAYAAKITQPTLLIWGASDDETPVSDGQKLRALIPNSELKILPNAGHFVHNDRPDAVAALVTEFLND